MVFSVAFDQSADITNVDQLAIFIRVIDASSTAPEEFVQLVSLIAMMKAEDVFVSLVGVLDVVGVDWACSVSVPTHGTPWMTGKKAVKVKEKVRTANGGRGFCTFHCENCEFHENKMETCGTNIVPGIGTGPCISCGCTQPFQQPD